MASMAFIFVVCWFFFNIKFFNKNFEESGLENSTRRLIFTSASGCRASENFDISSENQIFPHICQ